jgi:hypothetical protein
MSDKIRVFIGSASEDLPVVKIIASALKGRALAVPWTDENITRTKTYFIESLIEAAEEMDLALFVFGTADTVMSRGVNQPIPRDNVLFELGLFMSQLAVKRCLIVAPATWVTNLKILSDLMGVNNIVNYTPPRFDPADSDRKRAKLLQTALDPVLPRIKAWVAANNIRRDVRGPSNVTSVSGDLKAWMDGSLRPRDFRRIDNLALDLEVTWPLFRDNILAADDVRNLHIRSLMIDHTSSAIQAVTSRTVSIKIAQDREGDVAEYCRMHARALTKRRVRFECRAYRDVPSFHGFLFGDKTVLLSACGVRKGKLDATASPYLRLDQPSTRSRDQTAHYLIDVFKQWFEHRWQTARKVWPR